MPKRTLTKSVTLVRNSKRVTLQPGQTHDLTQQEIDDILAVAPDALSTTATIDLDESETVEKTPAEIKAAAKAARDAARATTGPATSETL